MYGKVTLDDVRSLNTLQAFHDDQLALLAQVMVRRVYAPGQFIFLEDDPSVGIWFVSEGQVRIVKQSLNGRVQALCQMNAGRCFGSCPLFQTSRNPATAIAIDRVTLFILPQAGIDQFMRDDPAFGAVLLRIYSQRLSHMARLSERLGAWPAPDRINDCLVSYADYGVNPPSVTLTHERIAALAGTVREVVTRHLARLQQAGQIQIESGHIQLLDVDGLSRPCLYSRDMP